MVTCATCRNLAVALSRFMGHAKVTTTLGIDAHLFEDDHADAMAALGAMATSPKADGATW